MKHAPMPPSRGTHALVLVSLLAFHLLVALTQSVNCFPDDGWFQSQHRIVGHFPGQDNYTPIAAPAFLYGLNHQIATLLGWDLVQELYLGAVMQALWLATALFLLWCALVRLGVRPLVAVPCIGWASIYLASTLITQSFWSENAALVLLCGLIYVIACLATSDHQAMRRTLGLAVAAGLLLGLLGMTRVIPLATMPLVWLLFLGLLPLRRWLMMAGVMAAACALVLVAAAWANQARFGRLELSNSTGRHLWQGIYPIADTLLHGVPGHHALKQAYPDLHTKDWWAIVPAMVPGMASHTQESLLRQVSTAAIRQNPLEWLKFGWHKFSTHAFKPLPRLGLWHRVDPATNVASRSSFLPAVLEAPSAAVRQVLDILHGVLAALHAPLLAAVLGMAGWVGVQALRSRQWRAEPACQLWAVVGFFGCVYASLQIEVALDRYAFPYFPLMVLGLGLGLGRIVHQPIWQAAP